MNDKTILTPKQIDLVKQTWSKVVPIADAASEVFYYRLFEINPELRPLFDGVDLPDQRKKLVKAINIVVMSLDQIESRIPALRDLGRRHVFYGVENDHYDHVGEALLWTLKTGLKGDWNNAVEEAWTCAYQALAAQMIQGANDASLEAAGIESERLVA